MKFTKDDDVRGIFKGDKQSPCWHCGELTEFIDIDFNGAPLCSTECQDAKIEEFRQAYNRTSRRD